MEAGYCREKITPPIGTTMMGVGPRDLAGGCTAIHDDIFVRALYCAHEGEAALIMSFDLCFLGRADSDRLKGAIGRVLDLTPRQILLSATHSHVSPSVGTWYSAGYTVPDYAYLQLLETAVLKAACAAKKDAQEATIRAGMTRSSLPMNRRRLAKSKSVNAPNPDGEVCNALPVCLIEGTQGQPICLLFSIATHPSIVRGHEISAEYCGVACDLLDDYLGVTASLFLQGVAGDSKPSTIAGDKAWNWDASWPDMEETGSILAQETITCLQSSLQPVEPEIKSAITEMVWPLQKSPGHEELRESCVNPQTPVRVQWANRQLEYLDKYGALPTNAGVLIQGIQLGGTLRFIAIEGEPVSSYGNAILDAWPEGVAFPLGYANGQALYLPNSKMIDEGGMEVTSYWEYGYPAPLAKGMEDVFENAISEIKSHGI
jgi:hypothetical protein